MATPGLGHSGPLAVSAHDFRELSPKRRCDAHGLGIGPVSLTTHDQPEGRALPFDALTLDAELEESTGSESTETNRNARGIPILLACLVGLIVTATVVEANCSA